MEQYHYVYRINFVEIPGVYFGSRTCKCLPENDTKYLGSPKTHKILWKLFTPIKTILVTSFKTKEDAVTYENDLIQKQWDKNKPLSFNATIGNKKFHMLGRKPVLYWKGKIGPNKGRERSFEWKKNISEAHKGMHPSLETREKMSKSHKGSPPTNALTLVGISPTGEVITFTNVAKFVRENREWCFIAPNIHACAKGKRDTHRKWRFFYESDYKKMNGKLPPLKNKIIRWFIGIKPNGETVVFQNAAQFCRDNPNYKLISSEITSCAKGRRKTHKGWKFSYVDESDIA